MATTTACIGIDVGTSGLKGLLLTGDGRILATAMMDYPLLTPRPGWTEQDPEAWWSAAQHVMRRLAATPDVEIVGIGLAGQMHGSVFVDGDEQVIRPALLWNDARTGAECIEIERRVGRDRLIATTGNAASAGMQAPKILWLRANEPEAYARIARVLLPKDFIRLRLTGDAATDAADASGTLLLDLATRDYAPEILQALEISREWLPRVFEGPEVTGRLSAEGAAAVGLAAGIPVVAGGADNAAAAIGAGCIAAGDGVVSIGTSGTIFVHADQPMIDPTGALNGFCDCRPGGYLTMGCILSAGGALRWYRDTVATAEVDAAEDAGEDVYDRLMADADTVPAGAEGLLFLPYLSGERAPHMDASARAAWVGLSLAHDRRHMARSVVEGIGYALQDSLVRLRALGAAPQHFTIVGGGGRSAVWRRILAAQLATPLRRVAAEEGPAMGAAILAQVGVGVHADIATAVAVGVAGQGEPDRPDPALVNIYEQGYARYAALYPALKASGVWD